MSSGFPDWTRAYLLIGSHEGELIPVYVDEDGHLYAALQGEYEGQLRTIALDDQGRISAFIIDSTDAWGQMLSVGNAELAARLGSSIRHDRRGQLIYSNDFSQGWGSVLREVFGTGSSVSLDCANSETGGYSAKLVSGTEPGGCARIYGRVPYLPKTLTGFAVRYMTETDYGYLRFSLVHYDGDVIAYARIKYDLSDKSLWLIQPGGSWLQFAENVEIPVVDGLYHYFKLVIDPINGKYCRLLMNNATYDLSDYSCWVSTEENNPCILFSVYLYGRSGYNDVIYVDNLTITVSEPT